MDIVDTKTRSRMMSGIRGKDTQPELAIRRRLFAKGFRYRLHYSRLPGKPDICLSGYKAVIFVNGCFWHYHDCPLFKMPSTRRAWWKNKLESNRERDIRNRKELLAGGWRVLVIWECAWRGAGRNRTELLDRIAKSAAKWIKFGKKFLEIRGPK